MSMSYILKIFEKNKKFSKKYCIYYSSVLLYSYKRCPNIM